MWEKQNSYNPPNKDTLDQLSDDGSHLLFNGQPVGGGSTSVNVNGRSNAIFQLRGNVINCVQRIDSNDIDYSIPPLDSDRLRRMYVWTADGKNQYVPIPDGELLDGDGLVYDITTNTITKRNASWGNISVSENEYLLLYNTAANVGGMLSKYVSMGSDNLSNQIKEFEVTQFRDTGTIQGIFIVDDILFTTDASDDAHTTFAGFGGTSLDGTGQTINMTHNFGHMNAPNYNTTKDIFLVGNGSKDYSLLPKGWLVPNFKASVMVDGGVMDFNTVNKVELDFTQFSGEYKGQICWGYEDSDIIYLFTCDSRIIRKVQLGKGTNNLGSGAFVSGVADTDYNGSYEVLATWRSRTKDILSDMFFYKGCIYIGVKGRKTLRKCIPLDSGYFDSVYLQTVTDISDVEGATIRPSTGKLYLLNRYDGYVGDMENLLL